MHTKRKKNFFFRENLGVNNTIMISRFLLTHKSLFNSNSASFSTSFDFLSLRVAHIVLVCTPSLYHFDLYVPIYILLQ